MTLYALFSLFDATRNIVYWTVALTVDLLDMQMSHVNEYALV